MFVTQTASTSFDLPRVAVYKAFAFPTKIWKALLPQTHLFVGEGGGGGRGISCRVWEIVPTILARIVGFSILTQIIISQTY